MDRSNLPPPPAGLSWKPGVNAKPMLYGRHQLPDGRVVERSTHTASVPVARRRYCKLQREIARAYAAGTLASLLSMRAVRSDKGIKRGPRVKQVKESET